MSSSSRELSEELVLEIISRTGTAHDVVRCSCLLSKRWRNIWRSIPGGVLDLDKSDKLLRGQNELVFCIQPEEQQRFANRVDQTLTSLPHQDLDALKIGFQLAKREEGVCRWIEFGFTKRVKEFTLLSFHSSSINRLSFPFFTPEFLSKHDLSRLEVLEINGVSDVSQRAVDHILTNCLSL
ncbi:unnamed protein product [Linum trigynum]|uniref:F-box domain-containing protein n=1 Tax=Linum trigynum TaxID=586398 RepID=A0AAV2FT28_9ROSI